jgi:hypothetical protein
VRGEGCEGSSSVALGVHVHVAQVVIITKLLTAALTSDRHTKQRNSELCTTYRAHPKLQRPGEAERVRSGPRRQTAWSETNRRRSRVANRCSLAVQPGTLANARSQARESHPAISVFTKLSVESMWSASR